MPDERDTRDLYAGLLCECRGLLAAWLREAGFVNVAASASYEIYSKAALISDYLARQWDAKGLGGSAVTLC